MPAYNGNTAYVRVDGLFVVNAFAKQFQIQVAHNPTEKTAGFGKNWQDQGEGLKNASATLMLAFDDIEAAENFRRMFSEGPLRIEYCPQAEADLPLPTKPFHDQDFVINSINGPTVNVNKSPVELEYQLTSTDEPRSNMYAGDTVA